MNQRLELIKQELSRVDGVEPSQSKPLAKHLKMALNPYRFYRGTAQLFYADVANNTINIPKTLQNEVPLTNVMGDCHLSNFGFFTEEGAHGDTVIFAPNDFDDACVGMAAWDIVRFGVSLHLGAEYAEGIVSGRYQSEEVANPEGCLAVSEQDAREAVKTFLKSYQKSCEKIADDPERRMSAVCQFKSSHVLANLEKKAISRAAGGKKFLEKSSLVKSVDIEQSPLRFKRSSLAVFNDYLTKKLKR